jgi:hypothetical protein
MRKPPSLCDEGEWFVMHGERLLPIPPDMPSTKRAELCRLLTRVDIPPIAYDSGYEDKMEGRDAFNRRR